MANLLDRALRHLLASQESISIKENDVHSPAKVSLWLLLAGTPTALTVVIAAAPHWLEGLFGVDLDGGSGAAEWLLVIAAGVVSVLAWLRVAPRLRPAR